MFKIPLDEYVRQLADKLSEYAHATQVWSDPVRTITGWELESTTWHTETNQGNGAWRDNVSTHTEILATNGEWWNYGRSNEIRNYGNYGSNTRLQRNDLSGMYLDNPDSHYARLVRQLVREKQIHIDFEPED